MDADEANDLNEDDDDDDENSVEDGEEDSESELEFILPKYETSDECTIVESKNPQQVPSPNGQSSHQMQPNTKQQLFLHQLQQQHLQNLAKMRLIHGGGRNGTENGDSNGAAIAIGSDPEDHDLGSPETSMSLGRTPSQDSYDEPNGNNGHHHYTPSSKQPAQRRRARRKNLSPDDQAEALTEMSVRGLNLFRYASISDGVYQCMECAKENVQKTFKNKYSFQRHAFLYHEGAQRKVFPCPVCNKEFSRPDKMKNHLKTTHESYLAKSDPVYPMGFIETAPPQQQGHIPPPTTKIESVLNAIQLQQHLNMQKELRSQQAKFQQMHQQMISSPKLVDNGSSQ